MGFLTSLFRKKGGPGARRAGEPLPGGADTPSPESQSSGQADAPPQFTSIVGIDLGTTSSAIAVVVDGVPQIIPNAQGRRVTPSVVGFTDAGERLVGEPAMRQAVTNPRRTIYSIKRFMGRRQGEVATDERVVPYDLAGGQRGLVKVTAHGADYTPQEISALIVRELASAAEAYLGQKVERAVVTVPAYFNDSQRAATRDACEIAGLSVARIINEPTAAALAYGCRGDKKEKIAVLHLGGGTFDISILDIGDGVFEVLATHGDTQLGGDDFDRALIDHIADAFRKQEGGSDLRRDPVALERLREAAEKAKCTLSAVHTAEVNLPFIAPGPSEPKHLDASITREQLETLTSSLIQRMRKVCEGALSDSGVSAGELDQVILVGGATRMPAVRALARDVFARDPYKAMNPEEAVALGAAVQAGILAGQVDAVILLDVTPLSLGIETLGGVMTPLIKRNTTLPTKQTKTFSTVRDNQVSVDIHVLQGEREMAADNRTLGKFELTGIPSAPRGVPQIEVSFDIDANGILNVSAKDLGTGKEQGIQVKSRSGLTRREIETMREEAADYAEQDRRKRLLAEERDRAEHLAYEAAKELEEQGNEPAQAARAAVEEALQSVDNARQQDDISELRNAIHALERAMAELHERTASGPSEENQTGEEQA